MVVGILRSSQMQDWVNNVAGALLIQGHFDETSPFSPLSFLNASFVKYFRHCQSFISLAFLCGGHSINKNGPLVMIRSLMAQLLQQYPVCSSSTLNSIRRSAALGQNFREMCRHFVCFAKEVPAGIPIYCLIDGIHFYENEPGVLDFLTELDESKATTKILLTSHTTTRYVCSRFEELGERVLTVEDPQQEEMKPARIGREEPESQNTSGD